MDSDCGRRIACAAKVGDTGIMADRPAAIHWQIARRIAWYARSGSPDAEAVYRAFGEYGGLALQPEDVRKISTVLDKISFHQVGYWYGLLRG